MTDTPNYHTLPCGTVIPPEGIKCKVWDCPPIKCESVVIAYKYDERIAHPVVTTEGSYRGYEIIKEPIRINLSLETYHGEPLRHKGTVHCFYPYAWSDMGVTLGQGDVVRDWRYIAKHYERYTNGEWQPCYIEEEV